MLQSGVPGLNTCWTPPRIVELLDSRMRFSVPPEIAASVELASLSSPPATVAHSPAVLLRQPPAIADARPLTTLNAPPPTHAESATAVLTMPPAIADQA